MIKLLIIILVFSTLNINANVVISIKLTEQGFTHINKNSATRSIQFDNPDQTLVIGINEAVNISFNEFDPSDFILTCSRQESSKIAWVSLLDRNDPIIIIDKSCQVKEIYGLTNIPKIELEDGLKPDLLTFLPILNSDCQQIGLAIYYGDKRSFCSEISQVHLNRLNECNGDLSTNNSKNRSARKKAIKNNDEEECLEFLWFGIPCP